MGMTNKELLEKAAKAVGYIGTVTEYPNGFAEMGLSNHFEPNGSNVWNPLIDDGQALRLAVKLEFQLRLRHSENMVSVYGAPDGRLDESVMGDPCAATRRAIVRAAASMISIP